MKVLIHRRDAEMSQRSAEKTLTLCASLRLLYVSAVKNLFISHNFGHWAVNFVPFCSKRIYLLSSEAARAVLIKH